MITFESEKSSLTLPEIHRLDQHRGLSFFPHLDWYISNCNGHVVLGVDGDPCAPESTPKFYATCEFKSKDIADVAPLCGTGKRRAVENRFRGKIRKNSIKLNHNSIEPQFNRGNTNFHGKFFEFPTKSVHPCIIWSGPRPLDKATHILNPAIFTGLWSNDCHKGG